ncbi:hypothetical protein [Pseudogemmobacter sonorensis]|uniref:hypothetical protein n=1 Tax=Pseudogemmobacter sonorensis TaxID=2989681 RepID=UPI0036A97878
MAAGRMRGRLGVSDFELRAVAEDAVRALFERVSLHERVAGGDAPDIRITLTDGQVLERRFDEPRGGLARPLSADEIAAKFRDCAGDILGEAAVTCLIAWIGGLAGIPDMADLLGDMVPAASGPGHRR